MTLVAEHVTKDFGAVRALNAVTFTLDDHESVALLGNNGSGKSTCLDLLVGLATPTAGTIRIDEVAIASGRPWNAWHRGVRRTFQQTPLVPDVTCEEYVLTALLQQNQHPFRSAVFSIARPRASARLVDEERHTADVALVRIGLGGKRHAHVSMLTQEERRFLELARVTAHRPRLLLLDEPAAGLTPAGIARLVGILRAFRADGVGLLVVDHVLQVCEAVTDRVLLLSSGSMVLDGTWSSFRASPEGREYLDTRASHVA